MVLLCFIFFFATFCLINSCKFLGKINLHLITIEHNATHMYTSLYVCTCTLEVYPMCHRHALIHWPREMRMKYSITTFQTHIKDRCPDDICHNSLLMIIMTNKSFRPQWLHYLRISTYMYIHHTTRSILVKPKSSTVDCIYDLKHIITLMPDLWVLLICFETQACRCWG